MRTRKDVAVNLDVPGDPEAFAFGESLNLIRRAQGKPVSADFPRGSESWYRVAAEEVRDALRLIGCAMDESGW